MSTLSQFGGGMPVGSIIQAPFTLTDPAWKRCDGSKIDRTLYPLLAAQVINIGGFVPTIRTPASIPSRGLCVGNNTSTVVASAANNSLQYSTNNGVTWSASSNLPISGIVWTGVNFVTSGVNGASGPYYATTGAGFLNATGAGVPAGGDGTIACDTTGIVLLHQVGDGVYRSTNHGQAYTAISLVSASNTTTPLVWTGQSFIAFGSSTNSNYQTSPSGSTGTWTLRTGPWSSAVLQAVSDGAGKVLILIGTGLFSSIDHGNTWVLVLTPTATSTLSTLSCANGKFTISVTNSSEVTISSDLISFISVPGMVAANSATTATAYAGGNYCFVGPSGITTATEDSTKMYLPTSRRISNIHVANYQEWIKVS